jgi:predicted TIM-barrel fold metal-dependent hydrolase
MIVDVHYHPVIEDWHSDQWWQTIGTVYVHALKSMGMETNLEAVRQDILETFWDPDGSKLVAEMDEAGIDKTVILPQDLAYLYGEPPIGIKEQNRAFAEMQEAYPDRIVAFAGVDPRRPGALELVETAVKDWGLKGVKLHPGTGWYPDGKEGYHFLSKVAQWGLPVLTHTGIWMGRNKPCDPLHLDEVLLDFPHLKIIAAHLGSGFGRRVFEMSAHRPNLAVDFSGRQVTALKDRGAFRSALRNALDAFGSDRVFFGTDGPFMRPAMSNKAFVEMVKGLPTDASDGMRFSEAEIHAILGDAAASWLGIA